MSANTIFVTGTDTDCGKTQVSLGLIRALVADGARVAAFKPVAAGCELGPAGLQNADALALQEASNLNLDYAQVNPVALEPPIAPHIAAAERGLEIRIAELRAAHERLSAAADWVVVEGAGGVLVPLGAHCDMLDLAVNWPSVLVVGMRLGCLNHALLSAHILRERGRLFGWVAVCLPPVQDRLQENISALRQRLPVPCLGVVGVGEIPWVQADVRQLKRAWSAV